MEFNDDNNEGIYTARETAAAKIERESTISSVRLLYVCACVLHKRDCGVEDSEEIVIKTAIARGLLGWWRLRGAT